MTKNPINPLRWLVALCVVLVWSCSQPLCAQQEQPQFRLLGEHEHRAEIDLMTGDTLAVIYIKDIYCFTKKHFRNKKHEEKYMQMVRDVKKTLPLAKEAKQLMLKAYVDSEGMSEKQQRAYFQKLEKDLMPDYKPRLKRLNYRQGKLLVRLIDRETSRQTYQIIREMMGKSRAFFWNMLGRMFGVSLKAEWEPDGKDRELEDICIQVEQGLI